MLLQNGSAPSIPIVRQGAGAPVSAHLIDSAFNINNENTINNQTSYTEVTFLAAATSVNGPYIVYARDAGGITVGFASGTIVASVAGGLDAAGVRAAVGLAAANLDTQLGTLSTLNAAGVRAAVGLAAANLDTQLGALSTLDAAAVRAAVGLAAANLDAQLSGLTPLSAAGVRAAVGLAAANLDTQLGNVLAAIAASAQPGDAMTLTAGERVAMSNALLDLANGVETGVTVRQCYRLAAAILGGVVTQTAPGVWQFLGADVATARVIASIPGDGSRPAMTLNL